jgi:virginiamycin B lyase
LVVSVVLVAVSAMVAGSARAALYWSSGGGLARSNMDGSLFDGQFVPASQSGPFFSYAGCEGVAVDASHVYWSEPGRGTIARADLNGSGADYNFISGLENPCGMALDGTSVYWAEEAGGTIGRAALDGNEVDRHFVGGIVNPCGVAVGGGYLYWTSDTDFSLYRMPLSGGIPQRIYKGGEAFELCGVTLDATHVYWGGFGNSIGRARLDGSDPEPSFITGIERPCGIALQGSRIYWTENSAPGAIQGTDLDGGHEVQTIVANPGGSPCGIAADSLTLTPPPSPHIPRHTVSFRRVRYGNDSPVTFVRVKFSQAGSFTVRTGRAVRWRVLPASSALTLSGPEERLLKIWPAAGNPSAKALRARLRRKGKAPVMVRVRFAAQDGAIVTGSKRLFLVDRQRRR